MIISFNSPSVIYLSLNMTDSWIGRGEDFKRHNPFITRM